MGLRGKLNQRPSGKTRVSTRLKYAIAGGVLAAALILVIYYVNKEEVRKNRLVNINEFKWQKAISINHQYVEGDIPLINFPLLVNLFESDLRHKDQGGVIEHNDGYDILFLDLEGNILDHETELYNPQTGQLTVWVKVPELSPIEDTSIFLVYGNSQIKENLSNFFTWDDHYVGVWHFDNLIKDHSKNELKTSQWGTKPIPGIIGNAKVFSGKRNDSGDLIHIDDHNALDLQKEGTLEGWIFIKSFQDYAGVFYKGDKLDYSDDAYFVQFLGGSERKRLTFGITSEKGIYSYERSAIDLIENEWYHIVFTWNQDKLQLFVNGFEYGSKVNKTLARNTSGGLNIGSQILEARNHSPFDGIIDEVRVSNISRTPAWINTSYRNQINPDQLLSIIGNEPWLGSVVP